MQSHQHEVKAYDSYALAEEAVNRLEALGYTKDDISVVVGGPAHAEHKLGGRGVGVGVASGGLLGAILAGAASSAAIATTGGAAIPFVIGPLAAIFAGGAAGGLIGGISGGLMELGLQSDDWDEKLQRGGVIVAVLPKSEADRDNVRKAL